MFRLLVNIFVSIFVKKNKRAYVKSKILSFFKKTKVKKKAKFVGEDFKCTGVNEVRVNKHTYIGSHVSINGLLVYGDGDLNIGDYVHMGAETVICTDNHNYEGDAIPYDTTVIRKPVNIASYVWIGTRSTILPGTTIGEGAIIQAGSVVHGDIPPYSIAGGNPAKVFKTRNVEHFLKMKEEKRFF